MADKTTSVPECVEFHPCDTPRGMEYYNLEMLTQDQQRRLNSHKTETVRDNQKYLFKNPEIRGVLQLLIRKILLERPTHDIEAFVGEYFRNNWETITEEVEKYVSSLHGKPKPELRKISIKEDKHVMLDDPKEDDFSMDFSVGSDESLTIFIIKEILEEMMDKVHEQSQKRTRQTDAQIHVTIDETKMSKGSDVDDDDELYFDLGLDFDLDFSAYHEDDDKE